MRKLIPIIATILFAIGIIASDASIAHAQAYGGNGSFTFYSNANGQYWCYANGDVTFQSASTGAVSWTTAGSPGYIPCPVSTAAASYAAPATTSTTTIVCPTTPTIAYPYSNSLYGLYNGVYGGYNSIYGYNSLYAQNGACGPSVVAVPVPVTGCSAFAFNGIYRNAFASNCGGGFNCLAIGCNCNFPGSCGQGRPPRGNDGNPPPSGTPVPEHHGH